MDLYSQEHFIRRLYLDAAGVVCNRAHDYAPEGVVLLSTLVAAVDSNISIPQSLYTLYNKQITAIQRYVAQEKLDSDPIRSRVIDAANLLAFIALYDEHKHKLHHAWMEYWTSQPCECVDDLPDMN